MKGLLYKDWEIVKGNYKTVLLVVMMMLFFAFSSDDGATFAVSYLTMMGVFLVLNTISYDDFDNGMSYLLTLPITRKEYVKEKYVLALICQAVCFVISALFSFGMALAKSQELVLGDWMGSFVGTAGVFVIMSAIVIPVQLKFGAENGRVIMIALILGTAGSVYLVYKIAKTSGINLGKIAGMIDSLNPVQWILLVAVLAGVILFLSYRISIAVLEKKEY